VNLALSDVRPLSPPSREFDDDRAGICSWAQLALEKCREPRIVGRDDQLAPLPGAPKQVDEAEQVYVVKTLQWIVQQDGT